MSASSNMSHADLVTDPTVVLLLAGGFSRRFNGDKRIAFVDSRNTLLEQSISQFQDLGLRVMVCLAATERDDGLAAILHRGSVECLRCSRSEEGMGATLADGVEALGEVERIVVALADMPALMPETIARLLKNSTSENIVFPILNGKRGHPVVFGRRFFSQLQTLSGDRGAGKIVEDNAGSCVPLSVDDPGVLLDVDTSEDLERLRVHLQTRSC